MTLKKEITGRYQYRGTDICQHEDTLPILKKLFESIKPSQVLEIGTLQGGLTLLVRDLLDEVGLEETYFRTYDVLETERHNLIEAIKNGSKIDFRLKNIFNDSYNQLIEVEEIKELLSRPGPSIIMCDGGSKKDEFRILSPFLKSGDIIMAHDYASTSEYFEKNINNKVWNWHQIQDSDIQESIERYGLESFMEEEFKKVVWVCKIKK